MTKSCWEGRHLKPLYLCSNDVDFDEASATGKLFPMAELAH
jgi:hypothetical protein